MRLTRRDVLCALAATGAVAVSGDAVERAEEEPALSPGARETLRALAHVVYPTDLTGVETFVETYTLARVADRPAYRAGVLDAVAALDDYAETFYDAPFAALSAETRATALDEMDVDAARPDPDGAPRQRVRYYLVNELLYALYTTPTGAGLAGLENPPGHPGGLESYRRGPP